METKRLEDRVGTDWLMDSSTALVQAIFRDRSQFARTIEPVLREVRSRRRLQAALATAVTLVVLGLGYSLGGGFSTSATSAVATSGGDVFITTEQADKLRQQSLELQQAHSDFGFYRRRTGIPQIPDRSHVR